MALEADRRPFPVPPSPLPESFSIAGHRVLVSLHRVVRPDGSVLSLEPKVMRTLAALSRRPGEVVSKEALFQDVWDGAFVTDDVLTRAIGELRRVFADDAASPRVIETIRKSGYRLIAPIERDAPPEVAAATEDVAARPRRARWSLVLGAALGAAGLVLALRDRVHPARPPMRVRPLTSFPGNERDPAVSPDGSRVAYAWNGGSGEDYSLYVQLIGSDVPLRLTRQAGAEDRAPAWSPDGRRIAFTRATPGGCEIRTLSALGGEETPLAPCGDKDARRLTWSPDGAWLALSRREGGGPLRIELLSPRTLQRKTLTQPPDGILGDTSPAFSPDGRTLAFTRNITDGVGDIYRTAVAGGSAMRLTFDDRDTMGSDWSPDGESIVFSSSRGGLYSLWRVAARGGEPTWVAGGGTKMKHPSAARGRALLAYENWIYEVNLWRVSADPSAAPRRVAEATDEWNFQPDVSPDGKRIAFVSTRSGSPEVWLADADGSRSIRLTSLGGARIETPRWSPDGRTLVFSARVPTRAALYVIDADGGVPRKVTSDAADAVAPRFSRDGRSLYYAAPSNRTWRIWKRELATGRAVPVGPEGGYAAAESPDGSALFFTRVDAPGIWRQDIGGGAPQRAVASLAPEDWANWAAGSRGLYFRELCARHVQPGVAFLPYGASESRDVVEIADQGWSGFAISPDGAWLVYPRIDRHTCDIRLIENPS